MTPTKDEIENGFIELERLLKQEGRQVADVPPMMLLPKRELRKLVEQLKAQGREPRPEIVEVLNDESISEDRLCEVYS